MKNLETLIQELCPDGVEFVKLGECCTFKRGTTITAKNAIAGDVPVLAGGQKPAYYHNVSNRAGETIVVAGSGAYAGYVSYWTIPVFLSDSFSVQPDNRLVVKFVYYFLKNIQQKIFATKKGSGVPHVHGSSIAKFEIPLPPIEVQTEIVRILDKFTSLEAELKAELKAELDCRKRQYEYYRDKLLSFENVGGQEVEWKKMSEVCKNICSGGTPLTSKAEYYDGNIPWLRTQEVDYCEIHSTLRNITQLGLENSSAKMIPANCVIVAMYGATAAKVAINKIPLCTNQACCNLEIDEKQALVRYVYQWICKQYEVLKAMGEGSQHNINAKKVKDFKIPIPTLEEQNRIVSILDRFESLTTSLQSGLPAEIAARRKQYEHYRDKLLTFKRKGAV